jgi:hypothetical protein
LRSYDQILSSEDPEEDLAILVIARKTIEDLTGELPVLRFAAENRGFRNAIFRGFPNAYDSREPVRMDAQIAELGKPLPYSIEVEVQTALADKWLPKDLTEPHTAWDNSVGFSGSGLFVEANNVPYLLGIIFRFDRFNRFFSTNIDRANALLAAQELPLLPIETILPFTTKQVLPMAQWVAEYENTKWATPLSNQFYGRATELNNLLDSLSNAAITIVTGAGGVGKTRLCREAAQLFEANYPSFTTLCLSNKLESVFADLQLLAESDTDYLILIDDANRQNQHLQQLLYFLREPRKNTIKLLITVRDYAQNLVKDLCRDFGFNTIGIEKMSDEALTEILGSQDFGIKNLNYVRKIHALADGNPRLAIMAARVALTHQDIEKLNDAGEIFEHYFSTYLDDHAALKQPRLQKTLGLIGFFYVVNLDDADFCETLLSRFDLNLADFKDDVDLLENLELIDYSEDKNAIRVSEQNIGNYFFFRCFIRDGLLSFETLLKHYFSTHYKRFTEGVISANNHFNPNFVQGKLTPIFSNHLESIADENPEHVLKFLELGWFYLLDETLAYLAEQIEKMPVPESPQFELGADNHHFRFNQEPDFLKILSHFIRYPIDPDAFPQFQVAIELGFENVRRAPDLMPDWLKILEDWVRFEPKDEWYGFARQNRFFDILIHHFKQNKPEYTAAFHKLATFFLHIEYSIHESTRGNKISSLSLAIYGSH